MPSLTFYPLGNADCCVISLSEQLLLFDYANYRDPNDTEDRRVFLPDALKTLLKESKRDRFDVVAFTHLDDDHIRGSSDFFWFDHAGKYQGDDRVRISELWVPAAAITEEGLDDEARVIRAEARYRLKQRSGIRIFSRPDRLRTWLEANSIDLDSVRHLITDAGSLVPSFSLPQHGVEFFIHSPFAWRMNEEQVEDRNQDSIVFQSTFSVDDQLTRVIFGADSNHEIWEKIVLSTERHNRPERLQWDVIKLSHHCSYLSLGPDKGEDRTTPTDEIRRLFEEYGRPGAIIVSTCEPIPQKGSLEDKDVQPPHRQAANYYKDAVGPSKLNGEFIVTMEHPSTLSPEPLVVLIEGSGAKIKKRSRVVVSALNTPSPRAGS